MSQKPALDGIRVFEIGSSVAGPYGAWILAQFGAEVIKIEKPGAGDDARHWGPPFWHGSAAYFQALNRDKRGVTVDFKNPEEVNRIKQLIIDTGDVVLQNFRPGLVGEMGISAADIRGENSKIIYCNIGAFGDAGPYKERRGYDPLMQASAGLMSVTGEGGDRPPVRVGTSIVDMGTGMWCVMGVLAALMNRKETGKGGRVDTSLYETALGWMNYHATGYHAEKKIAKRIGSTGPGMTPYQAYPCADGYLIIAAPNDRMYARLTEVLGHPEWATDPRCITNPDRWDHRDTLNEMLESVTTTKPCQHWRDALDDVGIPNAPLQNISQVLAHPQTDALGIVQETDDGRFKLMGIPLRFDGKRPRQKTGSPDLGEFDAKFYGQ